MNRLLSILSILLISLLFLFSNVALAQDLTAGQHSLVKGERVERTTFEYTYRAQVINNGADVGNFTAVVTSTSTATTIVDGTVTFDGIPAGGTAFSIDTFTIRHERTIPFDLNVLRLEFKVLATIVETSPSNGEGGVAVTRETIIRLSQPLADSAVVDENVLFAEFGGQRLPAQIHISPDRRTVTLFYEDFLPASVRVRVTLIGDSLLDINGIPVDADDDGVPGGVARIDFDTLSLKRYLARQSVVASLPPNLARAI